ncbi:MAG: TerC family protein [Actinomycetes bacterium]|jgi:tellurite resistance protein TerC
MISTSHAWLTGGILLVALLLDLTMAILRRHKDTSMLEAALWTVFYIATALGFGLLVGQWMDAQHEKEYFAGWLTEYALSVDNLFVFIIILTHLKVEKSKQQLVLLIGIILNIAIRGILIPIGAVVIDKFASVFFLFGAFLLYTAIALLREKGEEEEFKEGRTISILRRRGMSTFKIALVAITITNFVFSLDSIPAIFGLTKSAYVVMTANFFALMGLRQLYFLLEGLVRRLVYLSKGLAFILGFIGVKMVFEALHGIKVHAIAGVHVPEISLEFSLGIIVACLIVTTVASLTATRKDGSEIV